MFKKRPRQRPHSSPAPRMPQPASKMEPQYWEPRLFKNTYTYKGRSRQVRGWSIKIQLFGKRKTFTLHSSDRAKAAAEACRLYQTIHTQGWDVVGQNRGRTGIYPEPWRTADTSTASAVAPGKENWKSRLIHRPYPEVSKLGAARELSVRIEHAGTSRYFPLGTDDEDKGANKAMKIYRAVVEKGWAIANQKYPRELTVALRWLEDPLAWTYTTFHTWTTWDPVPSFTEPENQPAACRVAIVEPDAGIRFALAACANRQDGFTCCAAYANVTEASREITRRKLDLVLVNHALPNQPGTACVEEFQRAKPAIVGLLYSVFEDSDQLFKSTPGGAAGYLLKRTPAHRIFDPIKEAAGALTLDLIPVKLREYFQRVLAAMPSGPLASDLANLTPREHEILALLAKGDLAKTIAHSLGISVWTVHGHVKNIFEKLHVHSRTEAVVKYLQK